MKTCAKCSMAKPRDQFYAQSGRADGLRNECKECRRARVRSNREERLDKYREYDRKRAADPVKRRAHLARQKLYRPDPLKYKTNAALRAAVRRGKVIRPGACSLCAAICRPEAHHADYTKPFDVVWLCTNCHKALHVSLRRRK